MDTILSTFLLAYSSLIPVLNPFGGSMYLLAMTPGISDRSRAMMVRRICFYSGLILFASLFSGHLILSFFGISIGILRICGGIVLFYAGWSTLNAPSMLEDENNDSSDRFPEDKLISMAFYPITLPLTMGPGVISVSTALGAGIFEGGVNCLIGMVLACFAVLATIFVTYRYCDRVSQAVGVAGADAISKIFSFFLACIGVSVLWQGLVEQMTNTGLI